MDITETLAPKSDQLNADDLIGGSRTVTITGVSRGDGEQPVNIATAEFGDGRPFKPCKSMRRVMVAAWGPDASLYVGRRMTLYRDDKVKFGGQDVGGIRISHLSHIDKRLTLALTATRGKRAPYAVEPLPDVPTSAAAKAPSADGIVKAFAGLGVSVAQLESRLGLKRDGWDATHIETLTALGKAIKSGETSVDAEFRTTAAEPEPDASSEPVEPGPASDEQLAKLLSLRSAQGYDGDDAGWFSLIGGIAKRVIKSDNDIADVDADAILAVFAEEDAK